MAKQNLKMPKPSGRPKEGLTYQGLSEIMQMETASIITDYIRQYVGIATETPQAGSGVFINQDRVLRTQAYQETAWYDLYAEVEKDPHISAILQTRKLSVAGLRWAVIPRDEKNARQKKIADFCQHKLEELENFNQDIYELMDAVGKGFSVSEIIWDKSKDGSISPIKIMNRTQRRFQFDAVSRELKLRTIDNPWYGNPLEPRKFICHRGASVWENPFGDALDQKLYWMWLFKKTVLTFWMKKNEVDMSSVPLVRHPAGANEQLKNEAMAIAQQIRVGAYGRIPENFEIVWAETKNGGNAVEQYNKFIEFCNAEMTKCILGQMLTTEGSAGGSGSKALGQVHDVVRNDIAMFDAKSIEGTINSTLIRWLVELNYGKQEVYPLFNFVPDKAEDKKSDSEIVKNLVAAGFKPTREWIMEKFNVMLQEEEVKPEIDPNAIIDPNDANTKSETEVDEDGNVIKNTEQEIKK